MAEHWLSIVEYARTFGISDMTIRRRIRTGKIQAYLRDGKYYIPIDSDPATGQPVKQSARMKPDAKPSTESSNTPAMKSHPSAERTIPQIRDPQRSEDSRQNSFYPSKASQPLQFGQIPDRISTPVSSNPEVSVEAMALLKYCNSSLETAKDIEKHVESHYSAKLEATRQQVINRDAEIKKLSQQIEDLQLLVEILERRRAS
jgi:hypothetical protein